MIKVYGLELSMPVNRVRLCLNAMGMEYEFVQIDPLAGETKTEEYLNLNPSGKVPAIDDDGFSLFESNAIMKYLCRKYNSELYPADLIAQAHVDKWLDFTSNHVANGVTKVLFNKIISGMVGAEGDEKSLEEGHGFIKRFLTVVDEQLGKSNYLASDVLSIADLCLLATIDPAEVIDVNVAEYPNVNTWRNKLMGEKFYTDMHPSYADTLAKMTG